MKYDIKLIQNRRRLIRSLNIKVLIPKMAQVTVVSKGMKWSNDAAVKALQNHTYIKVGDKSGHLLLSGAPGRWKKVETSTDVYVPSLRVAGNPALIRQMFIALGYAAGDVDARLAEAYNSQNYQTSKKAQFDAETAAYKSFKDQKDAVKVATGGPTVTLADLEYLVAELGKATTVARAATSPRAAAASPRGAGRGVGRVQPLAKRLAEAVAKGKVLDVSKMDAAKGTGIKMIAHPGQNSKKVGVDGLAIVSSVPATYAAAVRQLGAQYEPWIAQYAAAAARKTALVGAPLVQVTVSPRAAPPALPALTRSPLTGGLPTIPGLLPTTALPVGTPPGSPGSPRR